MCCTIRNEESADIQLIRAVNCAAFPAPDEADLVDALRRNGNLLVSLVAMVGTEVVGYIALSPVRIKADSAQAWPVGAGLAPVAVAPTHQRKGIGGKLIQAGLDACLAGGVDYVVVLGEPGYYQRFGFVTASTLGLRNEYGVEIEFMVIELKKDCLSETRGLVQYSEEFSEFS